MTDQYQQMQPQMQPKKKWGIQQTLSIVLAGILTLETIFVAFVYPGFFAKSDKGQINEVEVFFPAPSETELALTLTTELSIQYYMVARAYLDSFLQYDIENGDPEEYEALLADTITAFENAEKMSAILEAAADAWMESEDFENAASPTYRIVSQADPGAVYADPFTVTVYAKEDSAAVKWAKDITERYDKAPVGKGIRTLASQMGTDAKHAYAQLKQAQAILEGAAYSDFADKANDAYKAAVALKTAGTVASFVISAAPLAAGATVAATAGGILEGVVTVGGVVMNGANAVLEVESTASILCNGGEEGRLSQICQDFQNKLAPVSAIFSLGGAAYNVRNLAQTGSKLINEGSSILQSEKLTEDAFGLISYTAGALNDYMQDGTLVGGIFTKTDDGIKLTLRDTQIGTDPKQQEAMKKVLVDSGVDPKEADAAVKRAVANLKNNKEIKGDPGTEKEEEPFLSEEEIDKILSDNEGLLPGSDELDIDEYGKSLSECFDSWEEPVLIDESVNEADIPETKELPEEPQEDLSEQTEPNGSESVDDLLTELSGYDQEGSNGSDSTGASDTVSMAAFNKTLEVTFLNATITDFGEEKVDTSKQPLCSRTVNGTIKRGEDLEMIVTAQGQGGLRILNGGDNVTVQTGSPQQVTVKAPQDQDKITCIISFKSGEKLYIHVVLQMVD